MFAILYGIAYCIFPEVLVRLSGGDPIYPGWIRWSGGTLIAMVTLLAGLALSYSLPGMDENDNLLFTATPAFLLLLTSTLLRISQWKARDYLGSFK